MQPSEVRRRILEDHERLRRELERVEDLARELVEGMPISALKAEAEGLVKRLLAHMQWEEAHLLPALREADAWGAERAERLVHDHREQRDLLAFVLGRLRHTTPAAIVARDLVHLADLLREDMQGEENDLLDERVLRDDVVAIDVVTG